MSRVGDASAYLEAVSIGILKSTPDELPSRLREIARNLQALAENAARELAPPKPPFDLEALENELGD